MLSNPGVLSREKSLYPRKLAQPTHNRLFWRGAEDPPAPRAGAPLRRSRALRAALENARAFPQLRSLSGSSPRTVRAKRKGPGAGASNYLVGAEGLEPSILAARDFKSPAYANSATPPCVS